MAWCEVCGSDAEVVECSECEGPACDECLTDGVCTKCTEAAGELIGA